MGPRDVISPIATFQPAGNGRCKSTVGAYGCTFLPSIPPATLKSPLLTEAQWVSEQGHVSEVRMLHLKEQWHLKARQVIIASYRPRKKHGDIQ